MKEMGVVKEEIEVVGFLCREKVMGKKEIMEEVVVEKEKVMVVGC